MRILTNPKKPQGADIKGVGYKGDSDTKGYYYNILAGETLKFRDDIAEFLITTYPFLKEVTPDNNDSGLKLEEVKEYKPTKEVPNLAEIRLHPEMNQETDETKGEDFYGNGIESDTDDFEEASPRSKLK